MESVVMAINNHILKSHLAKPIFYLFSVVCLLYFRIEPVDAHRVILFAWAEGDTVYVESKFNSGKKVKAGKIIVTDPQGTELVKGTTNEKGEFSFKIPKKTDLKIVLLAGEGHRGEWTLSLAEIEMPAAEKAPVPEKGPGAKEILIGIGCILGLAGIAAYIRNRKKKNSDHESTKI
jgi:hypothetical protein